MLVVDCYTVTMDQSDSSIRWLLSVRIGQAHFVMCIHLTMQHYVMATSCVAFSTFQLCACVYVCMCMCVCVCLVQVCGVEVMYCRAAKCFFPCLLANAYQMAFTATVYSLVPAPTFTLLLLSQLVQELSVGHTER